MEPQQKSNLAHYIVKISDVNNFDYFLENQLNEFKAI